ncbi:MAG TPA: helix-turn-helix domain-containing protein [Anaerolineaceae bacterium]|nr:helix-turn-helix domain-containing protein [Anaerolineaceae bacterium]
MTENSSWFSISKAANYLGVHFTTLRRWSDDGLIEFVRTPGGKRKYHQKSLDSFISQYKSQTKESMELSTLQEAAILKTRETMQNIKVAEQGWYNKLSAEQRVGMRGTGHKLVALMLQYSAREDNNNVFLEQAKHISKQYGEICHSLDLSITECVQTFLLFRQPMLNSIHETGSLQSNNDSMNQLIFERMNHFLDEVLVTMVDEYNKIN